MINISTNYAGIKINSPIVVAASGLTSSIKNIQTAQNYSAGAVIIKSYFEKENYRTGPTPNFKILKYGGKGLVSSSFYSFEQAYNGDIYDYCKFIENCKKKIKIPVIASINCFSDEAWIKSSQLIEEAGADGIELNVSCPHGVHSMNGRNLSNEYLNSFNLVKNSINRIPIIVKISSQSNNPMRECLHLQKNGVKNVVLFNRFTGLEIDINNEEPILHGGYAGYGGFWMINYVLRWVSEISKNLEINISASGGVYSGKDIVKLILVGASNVQICSVIYQFGFEIIYKITKDLKKFMTEKRYSKISDYRGKILKKIKNNDEISRGQSVYYSINKELCSKCGKCKKICIYQAADYNQGKKIFYIDKDKCKGCGICQNLCPKNAIFEDSLAKKI